MESYEFSHQGIKEAFEIFIVAMWGNEPDSFEEEKRQWLAFQKKLLRQIDRESERLHMRQSIALQILLSTHDKVSTWKEFSRVLSLVRRLGYSSAQHQLIVASFTLLWMSQNAPDKARLGWSMLAKAEHRVRHTRLGDELRDAGLVIIDMVKKRVVSRGLTMPKSSGGTSRRRASRSQLRLPPRA